VSRRSTTFRLSSVLVFAIAIFRLKDVTHPTASHRSTSSAPTPLSGDDGHMAIMPPIHQVLCRACHFSRSAFECSVRPTPVARLSILCPPFGCSGSTVRIENACLFRLGYARQPHAVRWGRRILSHQPARAGRFACGIGPSSVQVRKYPLSQFGNSGRGGSRIRRLIPTKGADADGYWAVGALTSR
jgi:hypothetical protein